MNKLELKILFAANVNKHIKLTGSKLKDYLRFVIMHPESLDEVSELLTSLINIKDYRHLFPKTGIRARITIHTEALDCRFLVQVKQLRKPPYKLIVTLNKET